MQGAKGRLPTQRPIVVLHQTLYRQLEGWGENPQHLIEAFSDWKMSWPVFRYLRRHFGKDGGYSVPFSGGEDNCLMHVHLEPKDPDELEAWLVDYSRQSEKTSDHILLYAAGRPSITPQYYLLIAILREGYGHAVATDPRFSKFINQINQIACEFIQSGQYDLRRYDP